MSIHKRPTIKTAVMDGLISASNEQWRASSLVLVIVNNSFRQIYSLFVCLLAPL